MTIKTIMEKVKKYDIPWLLKYFYNVKYLDHDIPHLQGKKHKNKINVKWHIRNYKDINTIFYNYRNGNIAICLTEDIK